MSIVTEIERIKTNIANAYTTCEEKGATMPSVLNSSNLAECIDTITGGGGIAVYTEGVDELNLPRAKQDNLLDYTIHGGSQHSSIPQEYQIVDYILSSGTQYIDTQYKGSHKTRFIVKQAFIREGSTAAYWAIGTASSDGKTRIEIGGNTDGQFWANHGAVTSRIHPTPCDSEVHTFEWSGKGLFSIDGVIGFNEGSLTSTFTCNSNFYLFKDNYRMTNWSPIKFYYCQIYDNDVLVRDFVPCYRKSDNVVGLYDIVNQTFYTNSGTGTFSMSASLEGVGDYVSDETDTHYGEYAIPVDVTDENQNVVTTNIYINEPLRHYEGIADYINYKDKKLVRKIGFDEVNGLLTYSILDEPTEENVDLSSVSLFSGLNTLKIDSNIIPSEISVMYLTDL